MAMPKTPMTSKAYASNLVPGTGLEPASRFRAADFRHTTVFTASLCCLCAGLCLHPGADAVGARRLVSTPSL